jgi:acyl CoA:acetate/3-ketoacid CoA transferase alpha subunit
VEDPLEAVKAIRSGQNVVIQGSAATPVEVIEALTRHGKEDGEP